MKGFKNLGALFVAALGVGLHQRMVRAAHRAVTVKRRSTNKFTPHNGEQEKERRLRQRRKGMLQFHYYGRK